MLLPCKYFNNFFFKQIIIKNKNYKFHLIVFNVIVSIKLCKTQFIKIKYYEIQKIFLEIKTNFFMFII